MADFESKLRWLSERGNPVGAEEMIERIEADLAGDPLVVVAKRREGTLMTKTQQTPTNTQPGRYRGPAWAVAAFVAVLAVAGIYLVLSSNDDQVADNPSPTTVAPDVETMTDLEVIEAGVEALFSGDAERAVELFGIEDGDAEAQKRLDDRIRREVAFQAAIGGRMTLDCTEEVNSPGVFTCNVPYQNAVTDAVGGELPGVPFRVVVQNGVITEFGIPHHIVQGFTHSFEWGDHMGDMAYFLRYEVGSEACWDDPRTAECARLIRDHLDGWAAWCGQLGMTACEPVTTSFRDGEGTLLDGDVTFAAGPPWHLWWEESPTAMALWLSDGRNENVVITADPLTTGVGCELGPPAGDAEAWVRSIMADPDFETIGITPVRIAGIDGLQMDVQTVVAGDVGVCFWHQWVFDNNPPYAGWRMRLYAVDFPGDAARVLAIAVIAPEETFERVLEKATPIVESLEINSG